MLLRILGTAGTILLMSSATYAYDFTAAYALFAQRGSDTAGMAKTQEAIAAYDVALPQVKGDELLYAATQSARAISLLGSSIKDTPANAKERAEVFSKCVDNITNYLSPDKFGSKTENYYYWKSLCRIQQMRNASDEDKLKYGNMVIEDLRTCLKPPLDFNFEGGGCNRLLGIIYTKLPGANGGGFAEAKKQFVKALESGTYPYKKPDGQTEVEDANDVGETYYSAYVFYGELLFKADKKAEAKTMWKEALETGRGGRVANRRIPETELDFAELEEKLKLN